MFRARKEKQQNQLFEHASITTCTLFTLSSSCSTALLPIMEKKMIPEYSADLGSWLGNVYKIRTINYEEHRHPSISSSCIYSTTTYSVK